MRPLRALGAALAAAMTVVAVGVTPATAASPCWQRVIADWSDNGRVDGTYGLACYRAAVKHLPEDLRAYSSAPAEIDRALEERRVALPASSRAASAGPPTQQDVRGADSNLVLLVPPVAAVFVALGAGWWLVGSRRRRPTRGR